MKAIVYMSETGHTKKYAELLSERISLPAYGTAFETVRGKRWTK